MLYVTTAYPLRAGLLLALLDLLRGDRLLLALLLADLQEQIHR